MIVDVVVVIVNVVFVVVVVAPIGSCVCRSLAPRSQEKTGRCTHLDVGRPEAAVPGTVVFVVVVVVFVIAIVVFVAFVFTSFLL